MLFMKRHAFILFLSFLFAGCSLIDDDLSVCETEDTVNNVQYQIEYKMELVTEMHMIVDEKLATDIEKPLADTLKRWLQPLFSGHAHDLDMNFYTEDGTDELRHHREEMVNANQKSFTLYIPREDYMHLALVNIAENDNITIMGKQHAASMRIEQNKVDTLPSHPTAIYSARLPMIMAEDGNLTFNVHLYMVNSAVALVITNSKLVSPKMDVLMKGSATGFAVKDSVYSFEKQTLVRAEKVTDFCYVAVTMPSDTVKQTPSATVAKKTNEPNAVWQLVVHVTLPDGKKTETLLSSDTSLDAGRLEIIKCQLNEDGSVTPLQSPHIGATVTLDWKEGGSHDIDV